MHPEMSGTREIDASLVKNPTHLEAKSLVCPLNINLVISTP
jgi:hypothetical protein